MLKVNWVIKNMQNPLRPSGFWRKPVSEIALITTGTKGLFLVVKT